MTQLDNKSDWSLRAVGEILERVSNPVKLEELAEYCEIGIRSHCKGIFHKPKRTGKEIGTKRVFWVEPGCFVFNIIFAWEQAIAVTTSLEEGMIASHRFPMYRSRNGCFLTKYALLYFSTARGKYDLGIASPGGAGRNKTLGQSEFSRLRVPVPPVKHQQFTIDVMESAAQAVTRIGQLIKAKGRLKRGLMQQFLLGSRRFPEFGKAAKWHEMRLGDVADVIVSNVDKKSEHGERSVRLCNYTDVYYNNSISNRLVFARATASESEVSKFGIRKYDVIITKDSETPEDIAVPAIVTEELSDVVCGYHLAILRCNRERLWPPFLSHLLKSHAVRHRFFTLANGVTRFGLSCNAISGARLLAPNVPEQKRIAALLDALDCEIELLQDQQKVLRKQQKGLMQRLLYA